MTEGPDTPHRELVDLGRGAAIEPGRLRYSFSRSGGPGGQNVNKVSSKAELRVRVEDIEGLNEVAVVRLRRLAGQRLTNDDEILIVSEQYRSQLDNRRACLDRFRALVEEAATIPKKRKRKRPTRAMIERRLQAKRKLKEKKSRRRWRGE